MHALRPLVLFAGLAVGIACAPGTQRGVLEFGDQVMNEAALEERIRRPGFSPYRGQASDLKNAVLRDAVIEMALLVDPPTRAEKQLIQDIGHRQQLDRCAAIELRKRWSEAGNPADLARVYFEAHRNEFDVPDTFILQMIFIPYDEPGSEHLATAILDRVAGDPDSFGVLAQRHSQSQTAANGGLTPPMKATDIHPSLRREIAAHRGSTAPFLARIDRGIYVIRIVNYLDGAPASFERVAKEAMAAARQDFTEAFHNENVRRLLETRTLDLNQHILHAPHVIEDAVVWSLDDRKFKVGDVLPGWQPEPATTGPELRRAQEAHLNRIAFESLYDCTTMATHSQEVHVLTTSRIGPALRSFVVDNMADELNEFLATHKSVMRRPGQHTIDLIALPPQSDDPYRDLEVFSQVARDIVSGTPMVSIASALGGWAYEKTIIDDTLLARYDPTIPGRIRSLSDDELLGPFYSENAHAYLIIRLIQRGVDQDIDPDQPDDLDRLVSLFLSDQRETALNLWYEALLELVVIDHESLDRIVERNLIVPDGEAS